MKILHTLIILLTLCALPALSFAQDAPVERSESLQNTAQSKKAKANAKCFTPAQRNAAITQCKKAKACAKGDKKCEDTCLKEKGGQLCGTTDHF